ncbi:MAG: VOC family protein [Acidobacteriota bacterium]
MSPRTFQVTFYTRDPPRLARFWASALGYVEEPPPHGFTTWEAFAIAHDIPRGDWEALASLVHPGGMGPRLLFHRVKREKTGKNHLHLDVTVGGELADLRAEAERLIAQGARRVREVDNGRERWIAMTDPDGNEFCLQ